MPKIAPPNGDKKMADIVVKDNCLINASFKMDLVEHRLINLAITEARETENGLSADSFLTIHASKYMKIFGGEKQTAYKALKTACDSLFLRQFSYHSLTETGKRKLHRSRWVSEIVYIDGEASVQLIFAPAVVPLITRLEKHFTAYEIEQIGQLSSKYAVRLYELLLAWKSVGKVSFDLEDFRDKLGLGTPEYKGMSDFKKYVLDLAVSQINELTDMTVSYQQKKKGVRVSGFDFRMKIKPTQPKIKARDPNTLDIFVKLSDAQRSMYGLKLARDTRIGSEYSHLIGAGSYEDFGKVLADMLLEEKFFKKVYPILLEDGFQPPKKTAL
jgi:plasmid replication initiation protein